MQRINLKATKMVGCITLTSVTQWPLFTLPDAWAPRTEEGLILEGRIQTEGFSGKDLTRMMLVAPGETKFYSEN